jgi:hypothetical protein
MKEFHPNFPALPEVQRLLWPYLAEVPRGFMLYGGTGLALRFGHRESVDFDFFGSDRFDPVGLQAAVPFLREAVVATAERNMLTAWVTPLGTERPVKVSFFGGVGFPVLDEPGLVRENRLVVASILDLAGTKAKAINDRIELKDYLDIAELLDHGLSMSTIVSAAVAIFGDAIDFVDTASAITYFDSSDFSGFPESLKSKLRKAAIGVKRIDLGPPAYGGIADACGL